MKRVKFLLITILCVFTVGCADKGEKLLTEIKPMDRENIIQKSTIHDAVRINDLKLVDYFIKSGTDINTKDKFGYTPLHLAARFNHLDIAKLLIKNGADINTQDKYFDTPLIDSTRNGYSAMSELLICNGAKRDMVDKYKMTPSDYALRANDTRLSKLLKLKDLSGYCQNKIKKEKKIEVEKDNNSNENGTSINIDDHAIINQSKPLICGDIIDPTVLQIQVSLDEGKTVYDANLDNENKRWCAKIPTKLEAGDYNIAAISINKFNKMSRVDDDFKIEFSSKLFDSLKNEFKDDFKKWNLVLLEDNNILRFKNPSSMFSRGRDNISEKYQKIFNDFFPRYIKIIEKHKNEIKSIFVEGHTSSRYRTAKTKEEKFEKNRILSQKRANEVLSFLKNINDSRVHENLGLIDELFTAKGMSSSQLIYNEDGSENIEASRRVEFKIELK
ncbi:MAG: ankyrin repeat domain-containing protein [Halarcobacter sp.]